METIFNYTSEKHSMLFKRIGKNVTIWPLAKIAGPGAVTIGSNVIIDDFVFIYATAPMKFGNYVHIACFASITGGAELVIGDFVAVSQGVRILTGTDDFKDWGFGNSTVPLKYRNVIRQPVSIGRFCIIGANSVVLPGVTIGEGAMVGANSVVTRNLEPWGIYVGNRRIAERNKLEVLNNYNRFLNEHDQTI